MGSIDPEMKAGKILYVISKSLIMLVFIEHKTHVDTGIVLLTSVSTGRCRTRTPSRKGFWGVIEEIFQNCSDLEMKHT